ncbi:hypothetical protein M419DRAFT_124993 [Trichoderma reesei RUT C-30]|uniref:Uncharacterized protein n=1 Tax=Hypocrea jecorina (strain ATCC 56765 / BCRC 32924 / NRRL 11460 / Rut C-30) TaxID=1344414 RepID=A0A024RZ37_HYPJR|nr:hypothetical protein M419DRAFT_124993 [Trichoderma reesei RUT C-30]
MFIHLIIHPEARPCSRDQNEHRRRRLSLLAKPRPPFSTALQDCQIATPPNIKVNNASKTVEMGTKR